MSDSASSRLLAAVSESKAGDPLRLVTVIVPSSGARRDVTRALAFSGGSANTRAKQDVLVTIMDIAMNRALTALDDALRDIDDPPSMLRAAAESLVLDFLNNPHEVTVCNNEIRSLDEPRRSLIVAKRDKYARRVRAIIDRGCAAGDFTTGSPRLAAYAVLEMGNGVKTWFSPSGEFSKAQVAREYGEFALRIAGTGLAHARRPRT